MDLEKCARCGQKWARGARACGSCGWVPIGANAIRKPRKERKPLGKWADPTKTPFYVWLGLLALGLFGLQRSGLIAVAIEAAFRQRAKPSPEMTGTWRISAAPAKRGFFKDFSAKSGLLALDKEGRAKLTIKTPTGALEILSLTNTQKEGPTLSFEGAKLRASDGLVQLRSKPIFVVYKEVGKDLAKGSLAGLEDIRMARIKDEADLAPEDISVINSSQRADTALENSGLQAQMDKINRLMSSPAP